MQIENSCLNVNTFNLFLQVVIQLLDGIKAGFQPPVFFAPLSKKILQLAQRLLVFLVTYQAELLQFQKRLLGNVSGV